MFCQILIFRAVICMHPKTATFFTAACSLYIPPAHSKARFIMLHWPIAPCAARIESISIFAEGRDTARCDEAMRRIVNLA